MIVFCSSCGKRISDRVATCPFCGGLRSDGPLPAYGEAREMRTSGSAGNGALSSRDHQIFDGRLVLTDDALCVLPEEKEVRYDAISSVRANKFSDDLDIDTHRSFFHTDRNYLTNVTFTDASARDTALEALEQRLAPRFQRREVQYSTVRAALAPFLTGVLIAMLTYGSMQTAILFAAGDEAIYVKKAGGRSHMALPYILVCRWLGPTGVAIVGGLAVVGCIVWLVARVMRRPLMITLSPSK